MLREWRPGQSSDFDDLVECPRWHQPPILFAAACWGAVLASCGLVLALVLGRQVHPSAFAIPGALGALAAFVRSPKEGPFREKASEGSAIEPRARAQKLRSP